MYVGMYPEYRRDNNPVLEWWDRGRTSNAAARTPIMSTLLESRLRQRETLRRPAIVTINIKITPRNSGSSGRQHLVASSSVFSPPTRKWDEKWGYIKDGDKSPVMPQRPPRHFHQQPWR